MKGCEMAKVKKKTFESWYFGDGSRLLPQTNISVKCLMRRCGSKSRYDSILSKPAGFSIATINVAIASWLGRFPGKMSAGYSVVISVRLLLLSCIITSLSRPNCDLKVALSSQGKSRAQRALSGAERRFLYGKDISCRCFLTNHRSPDVFLCFEE